MMSNALRSVSAIRRPSSVEPEPAAGTVPDLTHADFEALEHSAETCAPTPAAHHLRASHSGQSSSAWTLPKD
jgi:hypothetical protein